MKLALCIAAGILLAQGLSAFVDGIFDGSAWEVFSGVVGLPFTVAGKLYDALGRKAERMTWRGLCMAVVVTYALVLLVMSR